MLEWIGLIVYFILSVVDWASTCDAIYRTQHMGFEEGNAIAEIFLRKGRGWFTGYKLVTTFGVIIPMVFWESGLFKSVMLLLIVVGYAYVVYDNIRLLIERDKEYK